MRLHRVVPLLITASPAGLIWEMWVEMPVWAAVYYENYNYDSVRVGGWGGTVTSLNYYFHSANTDAMGYATPELRRTSGRCTASAD